MYNNRIASIVFDTDLRYISSLSPKLIVIQHLTKIKNTRGGGSQPIVQSSFARNIKTLLTFALWFALNIYYNIVNKKVGVERYSFYALSWYGCTRIVIEPWKNLL